MKKEYLSNQDIKTLIKNLTNFLYSNSQIFRGIIKHFKTKDKQYMLYEVSDSLILLLSTTKPHKSSLNIGFPFPVHTKNINPKKLDFKNLTFKLFVRGEQVRQKQRELLKKLKTTKRIEWLQVNKKKFRKIVDSICLKQKNCAYIEPYHFIGDSMIGFYFLENFTKKYSIKQIKIFSHNHKHIKLFFKSYPKTTKSILKHMKDTKLVIMPDLIDNQWKETLGIINKLSKKEISILILSRNLILDIKREKINIYHYNTKDTLLRNKNIQDYMDDCLSPFITPKLQKMQFPINLAKNGDFFINPFSSIDPKNIPPKLVLEICKTLIKEKSNIYLCKGLKYHRKHIQWVDSFLENINKDPSLKNKIRIVAYDDLTQLGKDIKKISPVVLTADTSIAHMLNRLGIPQITEYNTTIWDKESIQSMTSDSPLGFCRYYHTQYPAILKDQQIRTIKNLAKNISKGLLGLKKIWEYHKTSEFIEFNKQVETFLKKPTVKGHKRLYKKYSELKKKYSKTDKSWIFELYDPNFQVEHLLEQNKKIPQLLASTWRISPLYKLVNHAVRGEKWS